MTKHDKSLLIVEDEISFAQVLKRRLEAKGYQTDIADTTELALEKAALIKPSFIVLDMKIGAGNGLHILPPLRELLPDSRIILLTGYASIATAVEAIKAGADDYLAKPLDSASLIAALENKKNTADPIQDSSMSPSQIEWEHIQQVLRQNDGNISATARQLNMHRRTLQRKLLKKPPRVN